MDVQTSLLEFVRHILIKHEGREMRVYKDSLGIPTIGSGYNLTQPGARETITQIGADYDALLSGTAVLTSEQCDQLLNLSIIAAVEWLTKVFPDFSSYSVQRQAALIDMAFMGEGHFMEFHNLIADVQKGDWPDAEKEALDSKWAVEVGSRAHDDLVLMSQG